MLSDTINTGKTMFQLSLLSGSFAGISSNVTAEDLAGDPNNTFKFMMILFILLSFQLELVICNDCKEKLIVDHGVASYSEH